MSTVQLVILDRAFTVSREAAREIAADPAKADLLYEALSSFRGWLDVWEFLDGESQQRRILGETLWPGQSRFVDAIIEHPWCISCKARKVGLTSICAAYDGYVLRTQPDALVAAVSYRQQASDAIKKQVLEGLRALPTFMQLPTSSTTTTITLQGGGELISFPATERSAIDRSFAHIHCDEIARYISPENTYQALLPSAAGSFHIISTSNGPESLLADLWRRAELREEGFDFEPVFVSSLERPGRDERWFEGMVKTLGSGRARMEYPRDPEEALSGTGERFFDPDLIDRTMIDAWSLRPYVPQSERPPRYRHRRPRYVAFADIGVRDAFCLVVIDCTEDLYDVAHFVHKSGLSYPEMVGELARVRDLYPGIRITVESNNAGSAVIQNCPFPVESWWTSAKSKSDMLYGLQGLLENDLVKIPPEGCERLLYEMRIYQVPDTAIPQDAVIALAGACQVALTSPKPGRASVIYA